MEFLYSILSTIHIFVCILLIVLILLQKGTGSGLFTSSSTGNPFMSGMEITTFLSTFTKYLGVFFLVNTLAIAALSVKISNKNQIVETGSESQVQQPIGSQ